MYDESLAHRIREYLFVHNVDFEEKKAFQGLAFMVEEKMCIGIRNEEIMCRIALEKAALELENNFCRPMIHAGKIVKGYIFVGEEGYKRKKDFEYYMQLCLDYNPLVEKKRK